MTTSARFLTSSPRAATSVATTPKRADWSWIPQQFEDGGPSRRHVTVINQVGSANAEVSRLIGRCICPSYLTPPMAAEIFEFREIARTRRLPSHKLGTIPSRRLLEDRQSGKTPLQLGALLTQCWETVARKIGPAQRRLLRPERFRSHPSDKPRSMRIHRYLPRVSVR